MLLALLLASAPNNAVAVHPLSLLQGGVAVEGEHFVARPVSLALTLGVRAPAGADFKSFTVGGSLEARWWVLGQSPWLPLGDCERGGPMVSVRAIVEGNRLEQGTRLVGSTVTLGAGLSAGYRQSLACRLTVTPSVGVDAKADFLAGLPPVLKPFLVLGLTVGWQW
jgi:hypothetical protein